MSKSAKQKFLLVVFSTLLAFGVGETYIRYNLTSDIDGNFYFGQQRLRPFRLPLKQVHICVDEYYRHPASYIMYDSELGWTIRPNSQSKDGLSISDSWGIRSAKRDSGVQKKKTRLRIALFGDSYTHSNDVVYEQSWGHLLEIELQKLGISAEVLNFGVPAYGVDQAYLRWLKQGKEFSPDIVIVGYLEEDTLRSLNMIWSIRNIGFGVFFSKPRFILSGDSLKLVNSPAVPPYNLVETLSSFEKTFLAKHEHFYYEPHYKDHIWLKSKLISLLIKKYGRDPYFTFDFFDKELEAYHLTLKILENFEQDIKNYGGEFIVVYLPGYNNLKGKWPRSKLLSRIDEIYDVVNPNEEIVKKAKATTLESFFADIIVGGKQIQGHYSLKGNQVIAEHLAKRVRKLLQEKKQRL